MAQIREVWPQLHKDAQQYIACFETLAQLALLQMAHSRLGHKYLSFAMPAGSDNTPTEAGVNKLFSTAWPLSLPPPCGLLVACSLSRPAGLPRLRQEERLGR